MKKLTVCMYDDNGSCKNPPSWFKHGKEAKVSWKQIKDLLDAGNDIRLIHHDDDSYMLAANGFNSKDFQDLPW